MSEVKKIKPQLSKGTRDFLPSEVAKRNYIFDTIKTVFRKYGFEEIETPAIERLETLTGKYGEEGEKLLFKILKSGDYFGEHFENYLKDVQPNDFNLGKAGLITYFTSKIADKGLRYDLTIPLARYVVTYQDDLAFPFKRFHIGPVWRADRPQKGRYQEFYQCDADVIGSNSLLNEVELLLIYQEAFSLLGLGKAIIKINNRKILLGLAEKAEVPHGYENGFIGLIDTLEKVGKENFLLKVSELAKSQEQIEILNRFVSIDGSTEEKLNKLASEFATDNTLKGIEELKFLLSHLPANTNVVFDHTLARGLDYYTGFITEVTYEGSSIKSSIGGGGRYANLTEMFGGQNMSGVGISFGIERIYDVMEELQLFPETISQGVKVLFVPRDQSVEEFTFQQVQQLRDAGIPAEIFLGNVKKQKQFTYAEQKNIAYLVEVGENEKSSGLFRLRNAKTRDTQNDLTLAQIIQQLK